ncbi:MAG: Formamidopyrimidine-DNA glycosylase [Tenericutes bacterium ADurb.Bin087]|nr:MAG: Formamidopyrimidine-DNA glycosylase [Tenericutes bacterium ADurb.Bin087]
MPELPEVETVRKILNTIVPGATIIDVIVHKKNIIVGNAKVFRKTLIGQTFNEVKRVGKYLIFTFNSDLVMLSHLRMEGKYIEVLQGEDDSRYARVIFVLDDGRRLCYDDSRQFGTLELSTTDKYRHTKALQNVGPEPFDINPLDYFNKIKGRQTPIKQTLLDQKLMSGLGNIYVDEVLYLSKIHPETPTNMLGLMGIKTLIAQSVKVLEKAIIAGGTTVRTYSPAQGVHGNFQQQLNAYGKAYQRCPLCNFRFKKIFVGGRGTTYCPSCQRNPARALTIAITGQKASGKTVISNYLRSQGEVVIDTDNLAKTLYKDIETTRELEDILGVKLHDNESFKIHLLREYLAENAHDIKKVNDFIHPLVKKEMEHMIKTSKVDKIYFEVPLLFSHKVYELFDFMIGVEVSVETQATNLKKRGDTLLINADAAYMKNRHRLDLIIVNDGTVDQLIEKFKAFKV